VRTRGSIEDLRKLTVLSFGGGRNVGSSMCLTIIMFVAAANAVFCVAQGPAPPAQLQNCPDRGGGNMPDLGYCEPDWYPLTQGAAWTPVIVPNAGQVWGDIQPGQASSSLCKWFAPPPGSPPSARGQCKTDISWITASAQLNKSLFNDAMFNYLLRFQLFGACYRSTQVRRLRGSCAGTSSFESSSTCLMSSSNLPCI
jgi:hypothetical protein